MREMTNIELLRMAMKIVSEMTPDELIEYEKYSEKEEEERKKRKELALKLGKDFYPPDLLTCYVTLPQDFKAVLIRKAQKHP